MVRRGLVAPDVTSGDEPSLGVGFVGVSFACVSSSSPQAVARRKTSAGTTGPESFFDAGHGVFIVFFFAVAGLVDRRAVLIRVAETVRSSTRSSVLVVGPEPGTARDSASSVMSPGASISSLRS